MSIWSMYGFHFLVVNISVDTVIPSYSLLFLLSLIAFILPV